MKGIVLAGGTGSRLFPLTKVTNKHLLPVGRRPMIYHPIAKLTEAGIDDILIVTGREHMGDVVNLLGSGAEFDCQFTYRVQDQAGGIAQALSLAERFAAGEAVVVILGDNIFQHPIEPILKAWRARNEHGALIALKACDTPKRFGVAEVRGDAIVRIVEKPENPPSNLAVIGVYLYDARVYDIIRGLEPSGRGELEITDVNNAYIEAAEMGWCELPGWWTDAGTFESLALANRLVAESEGGD